MPHSCIRIQAPEQGQDIRLLFGKRRLVLLRRYLAVGDSGLAGGYAILTIDANADIAPFHDRQMAVLTRDQRLDWLDASIPQADLLRPLPAGSFRVRGSPGATMQSALAV
jgi:putative SOS response-associated peptidase YedK